MGTGKEMGSNVSKYFGIFPPSDQLFQWILSHDWEKARQHVRQCPIDVFYQESSKTSSLSSASNTVLHLSIVHRAPSDIVYQIFKVHPEGLKVKNAAGWTPLHSLIVYGTDDDLTVRLIQGFPEAVKVPLNAGSTLHLACYHRCSLEVLTEILKAHPRALLEQNDLGTHAAALLMRQKRQHTLPYQLYENYCLSCLHLFTEFVYNSVGLPQILDFCQHYCRSSRDHGILPHGDNDDFAMIYTRLRPQATRDVWKGRPAIHFVVSAGHTPLLQYILKREPHWARARDVHGRLPIHKACEHKQPEAMLQTLVDVYPEAVLCRDPLSKLFPAQLATTVEASYFLLQAQPSILQYTSCSAL